jgi:phage-related tail fiber protein
LRNATPAPASSTSWIIAPTDTGSGWIKVSRIDAASDSLFVTVLAITGLSFRSRARCGPALSIVVPNAGSYVYALPLDVAHSRLFFTLYSLSGQIVFKSAGFDAGKPLYVNSPVKPGIYIVNVRAADRQLVISRFVVVK